MSDLRIGRDHLRQYQDEGYVLLDGAISEEFLDLLRVECDAAIYEQNSEMDRRACDTLNLSHRDARYFIFLPSQTRPVLKKIIFSRLMAEICQATIGNEIYFFWDQFIAKARDQKSTFSWHQDSGYVDHPHKPYVNIWIPLDDVDEDNGTISILPFSRAGAKQKVPHHINETSGDRIGYAGTDPGEFIKCGAGSMLVFSSVTLHRSSMNNTDSMRRAYSIQFSPEPIYEADGSLKGLAEPFLLS